MRCLVRVVAVLALTAVAARPAAATPTCPAGTICYEVTPGAVVQELAVRDGSVPFQHASGRIDIYSFPLPSGGTATLPCVVLGANATAVNPCAQAMGTYVSTIATLVDSDVDEPSPSTGNVVVSVRVCHALLTATVAGIGVENVPGYTVC
jgi:hypothetical protein